MNKRIIILIISAVISGISAALAQSPIGVSVTLGGGLLVPLSSNVKGNIYSVHDYSLSKTNYNLVGKVRADIAAFPFIVVGSVSYNSLFDDAVLPVATGSGTVNAQYTQSLSILAVGVGLEYPFLSIPVVKPYASISATVDFISGTAHYENNVVPDSRLNSTNRIGIDLGLGTTLNPPFLPLALDFEVKYRMANLFGREFKSGGYPLSGFGGIPQTPTYNLNDAVNPNDPQDHSRSIIYTTVSIGVTLTLL